MKNLFNTVLIGVKPKASLFLFGHIFQNVARLTIKLLTNTDKGGESNGLRLPGFKYRKIGRGDVHPFCKLSETDFSSSHHYVKINNYRHDSSSHVTDMVNSTRNEKRTRFNNLKLHSKKCR